MRSEMFISIVLAVMVLVGLGYLFLKDINNNSSTGGLTEADYPTYKEIVNPSGFLNTGGESVSIKDYVGEKVVLLDFMTYSCVNCKRTFPYLNEWYEKYQDDGLIVIGIHTPEFAFEHDIENVRRALGKEGIKFPVVLDNDYATWRAYGNQFWPRKYLINKDGKIVYDHIGEGAYNEIEEQIVKALSELNNENVEKETGSLTEKEQTDLLKVGTREMYLGRSRIEFINNLPSVDCLTKSCEYSKPAEIPSNTFSLSGTWRIEPEQAVLESSTGSVSLRFSASKVHIVATGGATAEIYLDGELVNSENVGVNVSYDGTVNFDEEDFYNLIDLKGQYGEHLIEIRVLEPGFEAFAFTFG